MKKLISIALHMQMLLCLAVLFNWIDLSWMACLPAILVCLYYTGLVLYWIVALIVFACADWPDF